MVQVINLLKVNCNVACGLTWMHANQGVKRLQKCLMGSFGILTRSLIKGLNVGANFNHFRLHVILL